MKKIRGNNASSSCGLFFMRDMDWFKRRDKIEPEYKVVEFDVHNFKRENNHHCSMTVRLDDGDVLELDARVQCNTVFGPDENGDIVEIPTSWTVQGHDNGISVLAELIT